jgi:uncharacterized protein
LPTVPRFLCDIMLAHLARYLRAAGYDTLLAADGEADARLLLQSEAEERYLLTLDRKILEHGQAAGRVLIFRHAPIESYVRELNQRFCLDWLAAAFSRCLVDNTPLVLAPPQALGGLPHPVLPEQGPIRFCPCCRRLYWRGSHARRLFTRLTEFQQLGHLPG